MMVAAVSFAAFVTQHSFAQLITSPKASIELKIKQWEGTNASGLAFDPKRGYYYSVTAGNAVYPLEVFNDKGVHLYATEAGNDMRGLWWNKKAKCIEGNVYAGTGISQLKLDASGYPSIGNVMVSETSGMPDVNNCGVYDGKKLVYYYDGSAVTVFDSKKKSTVKTLSMDAIAPMSNELNYTSMIYTGVKNYELGFLNYVNNTLILMNKKTLQITATISLPDGAITSESFRFAYANKRVFLYDIDARKWTGYQIFE